MNIGFYGEKEGYSGIEIYSRGLFESLDDLEIDYVRPPSIAKPWLLNRLFLDYFKLRSLENDIVHVTSQDMLSGFVFPKVENLVVTVHDIFPYLDGYSGPFYSLMARNYVRNIENNANRVIAISEATKEQLIENTDIESEKIEVVYQGIDLETFRPVKGETGYENYYLHVGHELDRKNMKGLIEIFDLIKKEDPDAKLVRVGNGDRTRKLLENSSLAEGEDVFYEEDIDTEKLVKLYSNAEKLLFPSEAEGFGRPMIESLACGTPVIAFDRKPMNEVLPDSMLVEWKDNEGFAQKAVNKIYKSESCREIAEEFTWERTARETKKVYRECLQ